MSASGTKAPKQDPIKKRDRRSTPAGALHPPRRWSAVPRRAWIKC